MRRSTVVQRNVRLDVQHGRAVHHVGAAEVDACAIDTLHLDQRQTDRARTVRRPRTEHADTLPVQPRRCHLGLGGAAVAMEMIDDPHVREIRQAVERMRWIRERGGVQLDAAGQLGGDAWLAWNGAFAGELRPDDADRLECGGGRRISDACVIGSVQNRMGQCCCSVGGCDGLFSAGFRITRRIIGTAKVFECIENVLDIFAVHLIQRGDLLSVERGVRFVLDWIGCCVMDGRT